MSKLNKILWSQGICITLGVIMLLLIALTTCKIGVKQIKTQILKTEIIYDLLTKGQNNDDKCN